MRKQQRIAGLERLFPFPERKELEAEAAAEVLPFAAFGACGGYGWIRRDLVNAVLVAGDMKVARKLYYDLIMDGLIDQEEEDRLNDGSTMSLRERAVELKKFLKEYGHRG